MGRTSLISRNLKKEMNKSKEIEGRVGECVNLPKDDGDWMVNDLAERIHQDGDHVVLVGEDHVRQQTITCRREKDKG